LLSKPKTVLFGSQIAGGCLLKRGSTSLKLKPHIGFGEKIHGQEVKLPLQKSLFLSFQFLLEFLALILGASPILSP
jgi:hypothetical protein